MVALEDAVLFENQEDTLLVGVPLALPLMLLRTEEDDAFADGDVSGLPSSLSGVSPPAPLLRRNSSIALPKT